MFDLPRQYPVVVHVRVRACAHADVPVHIDACACAVACVHGSPFLRSRCPDQFCAGLCFWDPPPKPRSSDLDKFRAGITRWFLFPPPSETNARKINHARCPDSVRMCVHACGGSVHAHTQSPHRDGHAKENPMLLAHVFRRRSKRLGAYFS